MFANPSACIPAAGITLREATDEVVALSPTFDVIEAFVRSSVGWSLIFRNPFLSWVLACGPVFLPVHGKIRLSRTSDTHLLWR